MESGHGDVAVLLIEAGADRNRVCTPIVFKVEAEALKVDEVTLLLQTNEEGLEPEQMEGIGGVEQKRLRDYIVQRCGPP